ncbi:MAG: hypothetical protein HZB76_04530 [Chlamydiae bacterium]|nr:hypothetical protein [Chlamydiota bacterium]
MNNSDFFKERFVLDGGIPLLLLGEKSEKDRFVIMTLKDFLKLTRSSIKNGK